MAHDDPPSPNPGSSRSANLAKVDGPEPQNQGLPLPPAQDAAAVISRPSGTAAPKPLPPFPSGATTPQLSLALGMNMAQPDSWSSTAPDVQHKMIDVADRMDDRQFQHAQATLQQEERIHSQVVVDGATARREGILALGAVATLVVGCGSGLAFYLIKLGKPELAFDLIKQAIIVVSSILGGLGLYPVARKVFRGMGRAPEE